MSCLDVVGSTHRHDACRPNRDVPHVRAPDAPVKVEPPFLGETGVLQFRDRDVPSADARETFRCGLHGRGGRVVGQSRCRVAFESPGIPPEVSCNLV